MPEYTLTNDMLCCFGNAKVLQKMLEKRNGKCLYKLFENSDIDNQPIKEMDYKLFLGLQGHKNIKRNPEKSRFLPLFDAFGLVINHPAWPPGRP